MTERPARDPDPVASAARFAAFGRSAGVVGGADLAAATGALQGDPDPRVRSAALGALVRTAGSAAARAAWTRAASDAHASVRRRAAELAPAVPGAPAAPLLGLLTDPDPLVAEAGAAALGEITWGGPARAGVVAALAATTTDHAEPLVREAAVAALGAIGDPDGLPAVLTACADRPAIRRRAVLALAPFEGAAVDRALEEALTDPDWQVRQAAEDLR